MQKRPVGVFESLKIDYCQIATGLEPASIYNSLSSLRAECLQIPSTRRYFLGQVGDRWSSGQAFNWVEIT